MSRFNNVLHITKQLDELLAQNITIKNREQIITQINDIVEKRGELLQQITPPFTEEEKQTGKKVVALNKHIQTEMDHVFAELKQEIRQVNKQKNSSHTYENPYKATQTIDGMFLDQKK